MIMSDIRYVTTSDFILRQIGGESVLVPIGDAGDLENSMISLNDTFAFIIRQFESPHSVTEVIAAARNEYEDPDGLLEKHITEVTQELLARNIIKEAS